MFYLYAMASYTSDEFYGDFLEHTILTVKKKIGRVVTYLIALVFVVVFASLWIQPEQTNAKLNHFFVNVAGSDTDNPYRWLVATGLFVLLLPFVITLLHTLRKYMLYPKSALTRQTFVPILSKRIIIHPRPKNESRNPRSHIITVEHPTSQKSIPVNIEEDWFKQLNEGDTVRVFFHQTEGNILYVKKG